MKKLILFSLLLSSLASCTKNKDDVCQLDVASLSGSYIITAAKYKADASSAEENWFDDLYPDLCQRDDITTLYANGTYTFTDGVVKCSYSDDDSGFWSLSGNNFVIDGEAWNVDNFDCRELTISYAYDLTIGEKLTLVLTRQ